MRWNDNNVLIVHYYFVIQSRCLEIPEAKLEVLHAIEKGFVVGMHASIMIIIFYGKPSQEGFVLTFKMCTCML